MDSTQSPKKERSSFVSLMLTDGALVLLTFGAAAIAAWQIDAWQKPLENAPHKIASSQTLEAFVAGSACKADQVDRKTSLGVAITNGDLKRYEKLCLDAEAQTSVATVP
jgi:hypothetical protein